MADVTLERTNRVLKLRNLPLAQVCILNHGGIRSILPKGNVTARSAYEIMPFENSSVVIALKGTQLVEMANYIVSEKKPHPLAGLTFTIRQNEATQIKIQGQPLDEKMTYFVATSDYLSNGGDNMSFFKKGIETIDVDYKIRNILIDYFKETDTVRVKNDIRINQE
jgi:2',3'-cyclic-nucleotide 2'-phosphodiesterase (5'-nucleotidase family)